MEFRCEDLPRFGVILVPPSSPEYDRHLGAIQRRIDRPLETAPPLPESMRPRILEDDRETSAILLNRSQHGIAEIQQVWTFEEVNGRTYTSSIGGGANPSVSRNGEQVGDTGRWQERPEMKPAAGDEMTMSFGGTQKPRPGVPVNFTARKFSMPRLAAFLGRFGRPVIDKTGLTGDYDFTLAWDETNGPSLTTALQEQLGLKFEPDKVPVTILVIDSAQKPAEN
jgi:hypothetical protein